MLPGPFYSDSALFICTCPWDFPAGTIMANRKLRIRRLNEQRSNDDLGEHSPAECVEMVWPLTQQAWAFKQAVSSTEEDRAQSRLQRHAVRLRQRGG